MRKLVLVAALLLAPAHIWAKALAGDSGAVQLSAQAINTACAADVGNTDSPSCASFELHTENFNKVCLIARYTYGSATFVQIYEDLSITGDVPWGALGIGQASAPPKVTMGVEYAEWATGGASGTWSQCYDVEAPYTRFRFTSTSGAATDKVTVYYVLVY